MHTASEEFTQKLCERAVFLPSGGLGWSFGMPGASPGIMGAALGASRSVPGPCRLDGSAGVQEASWRDSGLVFGSGVPARAGFCKILAWVRREAPAV